MPGRDAHGQGEDLRLRYETAITSDLPMNPGITRNMRLAESKLKRRSL